jgi:hypothetical protein
VTFIGEKVSLDVLIYATGFATVCTIIRRTIDILTSAFVDQDNYPLDVRGTRGTLKEYNDAHGGPTAYLGSTVPGFPNFFMILGTAPSYTRDKTVFFASDSDTVCCSIQVQIRSPATRLSFSPKNRRSHIYYNSSSPYSPECSRA